MSPGATCIAYADDVAYIKKAEDLTEQAEIVRDANAIVTCFTSLGLSINVNKTVAMLFASGQSARKPTCLRPKCKEADLPPTKEQGVG